METNIKKDVYDIVTEKIIKLLEKGTVPWKQPWADAGIPTNLFTEKPYHGINIWLLASLGYETNLFLTYKQLIDMGGEVKVDEKPHMVTFWKPAQKEETTVEDSIEEKTIKSKPILQYYRVYNIAQCNGIPKEALPKISHTNTPIMNCEDIIQLMPKCPKIVHKYQGAFYHPLEDYVNVPNIKLFATVPTYYTTLFHELVHSTGHKSRLNRKELKQVTLNDADTYSQEELIAELGSSYLCAYAGVVADEFQDNANYIAGWLKVLKNDKRFIIYAASQAQKASDYVLNLTIKS